MGDKLYSCILVLVVAVETCHYNKNKVEKRRQPLLLFWKKRDKIHLPAGRRGINLQILKKVVDKNEKLL